MNQEKIGRFIKNIRTSNNLSQAQFAEILGVSSQAVSKWETGRNIPDVAILKIISDKFAVSLDEIISGEKINQKERKNNFKMLIIGLVIVIIFGFIIFMVVNNNNYNFKIISSNCDNFKITGTISYNNKKSSIYISKIEYCGGSDNTIYQKIECYLYETNNNIDIKLSKALDKQNIKLENYLKNVEFFLDKYSSICRNEKNLYLQIQATTYDNKVISYKIPLKLSNLCNSYQK